MSRLRIALCTIICAIVAIYASAAHAVQPDEILPDPRLEARARTLSAELRCMVCQNQSIDDSDAPLARDIRLLVREKLKAGESDKAIIGFLVARYGNFILLKPPFNAETALLWLAPAAVLALGAIVAWLAWRRSTRFNRAPPPLSPADRDRLEAILARDD
jgi:cytochrome c-type biogenesis protein CcmH